MAVRCQKQKECGLWRDSDPTGVNAEVVPNARRARAPRTRIRASAEAVSENTAADGGDLIGVTEREPRGKKETRNGRRA